MCKIFQGILPQNWQCLKSKAAMPAPYWHNKLPDSPAALPEAPLQGMFHLHNNPAFEPMQNGFGIPPHYINTAAETPKILLAAPSPALSWNIRCHKPTNYLF